MYLLDSNIFITAKNAHYGMDFVPGFWDWLEAECASGRICSIDPIKTELDAGSDELSVWADVHKQMFLAMDAETAPSFAILSAWVAASDYSAAAQSLFLASADYQLVAFAHAHGHVVVTHERSEPNSVKRIKIPDACIALGVGYTDPFAMLRTEGARFVST